MCWETKGREGKGYILRTKRREMSDDRFFMHGVEGEEKEKRRRLIKFAPPSSSGSEQQWIFPINYLLIANTNALNFIYCIHGFFLPFYFSFLLVIFLFLIFFFFLIFFLSIGSCA